MAENEKTVATRRVVIGGASGMIGSAVAAALRARGDTVHRLVRRAEIQAPDEIWWNPVENTIDDVALQGADVVLHFGGRSLDARWAEPVKQEIRQSRVRSTRLLAETVAKLDRKPSTLLVVSATGFYGDRDDEVLEETSARGHGFLADVVVAWEAAADPAREAGIRVIHPRCAPVLSERGGALARMLPVFRLGAGGTLGDGRQWFSWIALDDLVRAVEWLLDESALDGAVNVSSPEPVTNAEFTEVLGRVLHRPTVTRAPEFALRLVYGEMADEMLFTSQRVVPRRLLNAGFRFAYPKLEDALRHILDS
jgi:hypothetical protein